MKGLDTQIHDYLARYAEALTTFDARTAVELWAMPGLFVDDHLSGVLESRTAMIQWLEQSYPLYQQLGLASAGYELLRQEQLSDAIVFVGVRWLFHDADGSLLTDSYSHYVLRLGDEGFHACVCIETDAAEKIRALAAERGIELPQQTS